MDLLVDRYTSPVNPAAYPTLAATLLTIGTFFVAWFCAYELTANKYSRVLRKEMMCFLLAIVGWNICIKVLHGSLMTTCNKLLLRIHICLFVCCFLVFTVWDIAGILRPHG
ncbi:hypothetical protein P879_08396 [Paragonimus westermani]|uniref:Dolichyl-diphosphooligosaccharide-protein glycosyltransferase subunit TMEM258 n=1 Tax=Paragonimus westermani TaxID=34504 RepID=A0A8T0DH05_9TREM|nr:hypothetical protein P879_08396 [Paragonimus westermani]